MSNKICPECKKELTDKYTILPLEIPYVNLFFCKEHYTEDIEKIEKYVKEIKKYPSFYTNNQKI